MRKNILLVSIFTVVIIGFGYFTLLSSPAGEMSQQMNEQQENFVVSENDLKNEQIEPAGGLVSKKKTLEELSLLNENLQCTLIFRASDDGNDGEGTYFISDGRVRGDFLTQSEGFSGEILSSLIIDSGIMYSWSVIEGDTYGVEIKMSDIDSNNQPSNLPIDINQEVNYECKPWEVIDKTIFVPPADVLFRDVIDTMSAGMEYGTVYEE